MNKRYSMTVSFVLSFILLSTMLFSCSEDSDCSMTARPYMVCNFYKYGASKNIILNDTLPLLTVSALETDSIILNRQSKVHSYEQPLRYTKDTTAIVLTLNNNPAERDTVWVVHNNTPFFISLECGYQVIQELVKVADYTRNRLDSVSLRRTEVNQSGYGRENLQIMY